MREPFVWSGEYGFRFEIATDLDATDMDGALFRFRDPAGDVTEVEAGTDDESLGVFYVLPVSGFFDLAGRWEVAVDVDMGADGHRKSGPHEFWVGSTIPEPEV